MLRTMPDGLLTQEQLTSLGAFLEERLQRMPCDRSKRLTKEWILAEGEARRAVGILRELERRGGCCCDCEVLHNVIGIPPTGAA